MRTFILMVLGLGLLLASFAGGSLFPEYARLLPGKAIWEKTDVNKNPSGRPGLDELNAAPEAGPEQAAKAPENDVFAQEPKSAPEIVAAEQGGDQAASSPSAPDAGPQEPRAEGEDDVNEEVIKGNIARGDTPSGLFGEWCQNDEADIYLKAIVKVFPASGFRLGQAYTVWRDPQNGEVKKFEYEIDSNRMLVAVKDGENVTASIEPLKYDIVLQMVSNTIDNSLFKAVTDKGEKASLAMLLAEIFAWEINFIRDVHEGDSFSVLLEKRYREGIFKGYGKVLGATFTNKGKKYEAFLFRDSSGAYRHFNAKGENLKKTLLQAPLSFSRVTSSFSHSRKHPIMGGLRPHLGVDYGAPVGTPVKAVGDGKVIYRGWSGGYGNQVIVRHASGLESMYSHLSKYAKGIAKGARVRQGQTIAFVGSTGYSTGPHLDFRLKQGGKFINPQKAVNPRGSSVPQHKKKEFAECRAMVRSYMQGDMDLAQYDASFVPAKAVVGQDSPGKADRTVKAAAKTKGKSGSGKKHDKSKRRQQS